MVFEYMQPATPFYIYLSSTIVLFVIYLLSLFTNFEGSRWPRIVMTVFTTLAAGTLIAISFTNTWCVDYCQVTDCSGERCGNSEDTRITFTLFGAILSSILIYLILWTPFEERYTMKIVLGLAIIVSFAPLFLVTFNVFGFMCTCNRITCDSTQCDTLPNCTCLS